MIPISDSIYDPNTAESQAMLWRMLTEARKRELTSNYTIVLSSVSNIYFNTRYHLRAANDVRITRNGPTQEIVYGTGEGPALKIKADKNFVTTYSSYKVTTNGDEDYTSFMLQYLYMGSYQEHKMGLTLTSSVLKTAITVGVSILTSAGLKLSMSVVNLKLYLGAALGAPAVRMSVQAISDQKLATRHLVNTFNLRSARYGVESLGKVFNFEAIALRERYLSLHAML